MACNGSQIHVVLTLNFIEMKKTKLKTKVSGAAEEKLRVSDVRQRLYITKTRWGVYNVLTEEQYERKLIFG
jgi:PHD/YefM family antitoxin component YafN of YafNO toxin-antitoxin module